MATMTNHERHELEMQYTRAHSQSIFHTLESQRIAERLKEGFITPREATKLLADEARIIERCNVAMQTMDTMLESLGLVAIENDFHIFDIVKL